MEVAVLDRVEAAFFDPFGVLGHLGEDDGADLRRRLRGRGRDQDREGQQGVEDGGDHAG